MASPSEASSSARASPEPVVQHAESVTEGAQDVKSSAFSTATFAELGVIPPLLEALEIMKFTKPTEIQAQAIPPALTGRDIIGVAETVSVKNFSIDAECIRDQVSSSLTGIREDCCICTPHFTEAVGETKGVFCLCFGTDTVSV